MKLATFANKLEIFYTLQGEGRNAGMPAIFIRLSGCNLFCSFCDAYYTFNWIGTKWEQDFPKVRKEDHQVILSITAILNELKKYNCKNIVITGGEPLLQQKELVNLIQLLKLEDYYVELETNGSIIPSQQFIDLIDQINCSPKLANSNVPQHLRERGNALSFLATNKKVDFKFVVSNQADLDEVLQLVDKYSMKNVWLMPLGVNEIVLRNTEKWLAEVCKQYGFRLTSRMQIMLYGNKPGT